jgi:hypothetical protein
MGSRGSAPGSSVPLSRPAEASGSARTRRAERPGFPARGGLWVPRASPNPVANTRSRRKKTHDRRPDLRLRYAPDPRRRPTRPGHRRAADPIYQTTAYVFRDAEHAAALFNLQEVGFIYSRLTNPTIAVLQERIATLEGGVGAVCCSSGHAAQIMALFPIMAPGQEHRRVHSPLRRHGHAVQPDHQALRLVREIRRFRRSRRGEGGHRR